MDKKNNGRYYHYDGKLWTKWLDLINSKNIRCLN